MKRNVEDILSSESPHKNLEKSGSDTKKMGERIIKILQLARAHRLSSNARAMLWLRIEETTKKARQRNRQIQFLKYSGVACVLIALLFFFGNRQDTGSSYNLLLLNAMSNQNLIAEEEEVSIQKDDGEQVFISDEQEIIDLSSNGRGEHGQTQTPKFNTLTVPYGKRIEVILPDNSKVWLNAGSQLTFPPIFDATERRVYLEGEGYFEVDGDGKRPFYVHTANMVVKVLGTTFNISSYESDSFASTVLLSGEIELQGSGETPFDSQILKPGTAATLRKDSRRLSISNEPVEDHVSWTRKQLILKNTPLTEILTRLERVYNTDISIAYQMSKDDETFSGRLDLTQPLTSLLTTLFNPIEYQLQKDERRILINKK